MNVSTRFFSDRPKLNLSIDILMFLLLMPVAGLGFLIKYVLLPGIQRNERYGSNAGLEFLGMGRHQWGTIHLILSIIFLSLLVLHILFHWKMIAGIFRKILPQKAVRRITACTVVISGLIMITFPLFISPVQVPHEPEYRNRDITGRAQPAFQGTQPGIVPASGNADSNVMDQEPSALSHSFDSEEYEISGKLTLQSVADKYQVPPEKICSDLKIPATLAGERLGRLKKSYPFTMDDVRESISKYKRDTK